MHCKGYCSISLERRVAPTHTHGYHVGPLPLNAYSNRQGKIIGVRDSIQARRPAGGSTAKDLMAKRTEIHSPMVGMGFVDCRSSGI